MRARTGLVSFHISLRYASAEIKCQCLVRTEPIFIVFMSNGTTKGRTCGFGGGGSKLRC